LAAFILHPLIPIVARSAITSSSHLILGRPLLLVIESSFQHSFWHLRFWYLRFYYQSNYYRATRYSDSLRAGRSEDRISVRARYSAPIQISPGAHPASCTMGTGSFPGVKWPGRGVDHPPSLVPRLKKE
jgi:hypothetical protein